jgi:hypothetical protein
VIGETVDLLTARLAHSTLGVNAVLAAMVTELSWVAEDVPPYVQVLGETSSLDAALGQLPAVPVEGESDTVFPALLVGQADSLIADPAAMANQIRNGEVELMIRDADRKVNPAAGTKAALRRMRAVCRVIERWTQGAEAARLQDAVYVWYVVSLSVVPVWQSVGDALCTAGVRVRFKIRDTAAY